MKPFPLQPKTTQEDRFLKTTACSCKLFYFDCKKCFQHF
ncbi:hypothetical protein HPHPA27_0961 [Helicobacter pylori Hp A-27]|nr:hypothetical protein HPHPA27_0961 [Helicobacter pylori Hp A-27]